MTRPSSNSDVGGMPGKRTASERMLVQRRAAVARARSFLTISHDSHGPGRRSVGLHREDRALQRAGRGEANDGIGVDVQGVAAAGVRGAGGALPYLDVIQRSFGRHDVSGAATHTDEAASGAATAIGARAYATGHHVAFAGAPPAWLASATSGTTAALDTQGVHR